jgi:hypothetical protein
MCAPKYLGKDECAVLTILQLYNEGSEKCVELKPDALINQASYSRIFESLGKTPEGKWSYRLQVFVLKPINASSSLYIGTNDFENLPPGTLLSPIVIRTNPGP